MKVTILHGADAIEAPEDPVLGQLETALRNGGHEPSRLVADEDLVRTIETLRREPPDIVFNLIESFRGKSALDSNVTAILNLLDLRYTRSSPSGLLLAGDKSLATKLLRANGVKTPESATLFRGSI